MNRKDLHALHIGLVLLIALPLAGCGVSSIGSLFGFGSVPTPPPIEQPHSRPVIVAPVGTPEHAIEVLNRRIDDAEATIAADRKEVKRLEHEALIAPIRPWLHIIEVIALLGLVAGVALAVIAACTPVSFAAKIPLWIAFGCGAALAVCLTTDWALDHLVVVGSAVAVLVAGGALWFFRHNLHVDGVMREMWDHVPESAPTSARLDALMDRLTK